MGHILQDVFGVTIGVPLTYVERTGVDDEFREALKRRKHIVVYGGSKQGKTCLRKHCLSSEDSVVVQCTSAVDLASLHTSILRAAGYKTPASEKRKAASTSSVEGKAGARIFGIGADLGTETSKEISEEAEYTSLSVDLTNASDVVAALADVGFSKWIILEDFHYLSLETQKAVAEILKTYYEASELCFIIVGVWRDEGRLIALNGDLVGRIVEVDADRWRDGELLEVLQLGERLLQFQFDRDFAAQLAYYAHNFVYILQEACYNVCFDAGITEEQEGDDPIVVGEGRRGDVEILEVLSKQDGRYQAFIADFARGFQDTTLEIYKWLIHAIVTENIQNLEDGIRASEVCKRVQHIHPLGQDLNPGNVTQALKSMVHLQTSKGIRPILIDYDRAARRVHIVDRGFLLWLRNLTQLGHVQVPLPIS